jgi:hypothetical protein
MLLTYQDRQQAGSYALGAKIFQINSKRSGLAGHRQQALAAHQSIEFGSR